jgi:hypothetical protein
MKKLIISTSIGISLSVSTFAQLSLGISCGYDYSTMNVKLNSEKSFGIKGVPAYHIGLDVKHPVNQNFSLASGIYLLKKGFNQKITNHLVLSDSTTKFNVSMYCLEVPVLAEFKSSFEKFNVLFGVGPYFSYALGGKIGLNVKSPSNTINYEEDLPFSKNFDMNPTAEENIINESGYGGLKRFDYGAMVRLGVQYKSVILSAEYKYGIKNLMWEYGMNEKINTQSLGLSMTYLFSLSK